MKEFSEARLAELRNNVSSEMERILKESGPDAVHDLRVSIRRFRQALRVIGKLAGNDDWKQVRESLRPVMEVSGGLRNRDIALDLCRAAGIAPLSAVAKQLSKQRETLRKALLREARRWRKDAG